MNIEFILIQLLGIIAWFTLGASYYRKNTNKILVFQIIGTLLYCIHYFLLKAWSGVFICACEIVFDIGYYFTNKDKQIYIISIPVRIIGGLLGFTNIVDALPICASLIDGYSLTKKKKLVVFGAIISYTLWVIYDIIVGSYSGALTDSIIVLSNISILIFGYNIFNKNSKHFPNRKSSAIKYRKNL